MKELIVKPSEKKDDVLKPISADIAEIHDAPTATMADVLLRKFVEKHMPSQPVFARRFNDDYGLASGKKW